MADKTEKCPKCASHMFANGYCDDCNYSAKTEAKKGK